MIHFSNQNTACMSGETVTQLMFDGALCTKTGTSGAR